MNDRKKNKINEEIEENSVDEIIPDNQYNLKINELTEYINTLNVDFSKKFLNLERQIKEAHNKVGQVPTPDKNFKFCLPENSDLLKKPVTPNENETYKNSKILMPKIQASEIKPKNSILGNSITEFKAPNPSDSVKKLR